MVNAQLLLVAGLIAISMLLLATASKLSGHITMIVIGHGLGTQPELRER